MAAGLLNHVLTLDLIRVDILGVWVRSASPTKYHSSLNACCKYHTAIILLLAISRTTALEVQQEFSRLWNNIVSPSV
jgi:hypothetical protein